MSRAHARTIIVIAVTLSCVTLGARADKRAGEWRSYGRDPGGSRYSPLEQITRDNVGRLVEAWVYHHGEPVPEARREGPAFEATPLLVGGLLYVTTATGRVVALDPESGAERWTFDSHLARADGSAKHRGVAYWEGRGDRRIFVGTLDGRLVALDALAGQPKADFGTNGEIRFAEGLSLRSPPAIYRDLVMTGSAAPKFPGIGPAGDVRAFDTRTGKTLWETTLPASGHATPMTYLGPRSGKQFVVIAAGGGGYLSPTYSDALVAFCAAVAPHGTDAKLAPAGFASNSLQEYP